MMIQQVEVELVIVDRELQIDRNSLRALLVIHWPHETTIAEIAL